MVITTKTAPIPGRFGSVGIWSVESNALTIFKTIKSMRLWQIGHQNGANSMPLCGSLSTGTPLGSTAPPGSLHTHRDLVAEGFNEAEENVACSKKRRDRRSSGDGGAIPNGYMDVRMRHKTMSEAAHFGSVPPERRH